MDFASPSIRKIALGNVNAKDSKFFNHKKFVPLPKPKKGEWLESARKESGQTFESFIQKAKKPDKTHHTIFILPLNEIPDSMMNYLYQYCSAFFLGMTVAVLPSRNLFELGIENRMNEGCLQFHAGKIIENLKIPKGGYCLIAVTMVDLYPRVSWNFVFGLASGKKGVFSFARFLDEDLSLEQAEELRLYRAARTLTHEVCHMFGIKHCIYYLCLMNGSNSLDESAGKPAHLCNICLHKLHYSLNFNLLQRYLQLSAITNREFPAFRKQVEEYEKLLA